jgi:hypothetical protein
MNTKPEAEAPAGAKTASAIMTAAELLEGRRITSTHVETRDRSNKLMFWGADNRTLVVEMRGRRFQPPGVIERPLGVVVAQYQMRTVQRQSEAA